MHELSRPAQVLKLLLESDQERSGQEMGETLGCSRAAVGKAVTALREQGFVVDARSRQGYRLVSEPPGVLPARVEARLEPGGLGLPLWRFERIDSTNLEARRRAEAGAPHGACLAADFQTAGRGRLDRHWESPAGLSLLFSLILRPDLALDKVFSLTSLVALALCRAIEEKGDIEPKIKWPNDVYIQERKAAGVLTEFTSRAEQLEFAVVGVGLNVNQTPTQLKRLPAPASSLRQASGRAWDRGALLAGILKHATALYEAFSSGKSDFLAAEYQSRSLLQGRRVSVREGEAIRTGHARGLTADGSLVLEEKSGRLVNIRVGDVSVLSMEKPA